MNNFKKTIFAGSFFDSNSEKIQKNVIIEVDGENITSIKPGASNQNVDIDLSNQTVIPGLIDSHLHEGFRHHLGNLVAQQTRPARERASLATPVLRDQLYSGVTTLRICGSKDWLSNSLKKLINQKLIEGPTIVECGYAVKASCGHGVVPACADGIDEIRKIFRDNFAHGVDFYKIFLSGDPSTATDPKMSYYSKEEIQFAIDEAHRLNKKITSHVYGGRALDLGIECGLDIVEHGSFATPEQIRKIIDKDIKMVLTLGIFFQEEALSIACTKQVLDYLISLQDDVAKSTLSAYEEGAFIAFGSDDSDPRMSVKGEMKQAVKIGFKPIDVIKMVTKNAATVAGLEKTRGTLEVGKAADLIAMEGNPLEDINVIDNVNFVMKNGEVVR